MIIPWSSQPNGKSLVKYFINYYTSCGSSLGVQGPKVKRSLSARKTKFQKLLFEVFPHEAVDDKVDGGVEHEGQLVDRGDYQPEIPGKKVYFGSALILKLQDLSSKSK